MIVLENDKKESAKISELIKKIDAIDENYANSESDVISRQQPFLISLILGYRLDFGINELEEITKLIFLIWEYFKGNRQIQNIKISENQFEKILNRNIHMLKNFEGEIGQKAKLDLVFSDLGHLKSKALLTGIFLQFNCKYSLKNMKSEEKGSVLIGMKSLIECFEEVIQK